MTERERLIELLQSAQQENLNLLNFEIDILADYLLANGVIVLPRELNLPDELYRYMFDDDEQAVPVKCKVVKITGYGFTLTHPADGREWEYKYSSIGKTVFLTQEEAEQALKGVKTEK